MISVNYPELLNLIAPHTDPNREASAAFLVWYLENYYRLDNEEAIEAVCDSRMDKGVDGVYINESNGTIDIFQAKLTQNSDKAIGDVVLKEFYGTLSQFENRETLQNLIDTSGETLLVSLIKRTKLLQVIEQYEVRGIFLSNLDIDANGQAYLSQTPKIEFVGKTILEMSYISPAKTIIPGKIATFDISDTKYTEYFVDDQTKTIIAPIRAVELVNMPGVEDQSIFDFNVRGHLGATNVNRDIVTSIKDKSIHKLFPLFHNGIIVVANEIDLVEDKMTVKTFFVVNGCQSLNALYKNKSYLTNDLKILTRFVQVSVDSELSKIITHYSNNQNGVKPRDFKSNNNIQVRLQNEIHDNYGDEFFYEIKRGEQCNGKEIISNEMAGILLMSFDLKEPWGTHRKYQVFDDKYTEIFGRPEVTSHRIVALYIIDKILKNKILDVSNSLVAKYALARYSMIFILRQLLENDDSGKLFLQKPEDFMYNKEKRIIFVNTISALIDDIITDFNFEVNELGVNFDYKSSLRDDQWVKKLSQEIVSTYIKLVRKQKIASFSTEWNKALSSI